MLGGQEIEIMTERERENLQGAESLLTNDISFKCQTCTVRIHANGI